MISLEQVKELETKVAHAIEYVERMTAENAALVSEKAALQAKVEQVTAENAAMVSERAALQAKLEANQKQIDELKENQGRLEDRIIAAVDQFYQFVEKSLKERQPAGKSPAKSAAAVKPKAQEQLEQPKQPDAKEVCFEIPEKETEEDAEPSDEDPSAEGELDIF